MSLTLHTVPTANGQRASIALQECGIDYESHMVDLLKGEHRNPEMLAINPIGRMPVLTINDAAGEPDRNLYGSLAIGSWAARKTGTLIPDGDLRTDYDHWMGIVMTDLAPAFAAQFCLGVLSPKPQEWGVQFYAEIIDRLLVVIDGRLAEREYLLASEYSLVDIMLYPAAVTSAARLPEGLNNYSNIARWSKLVGRRDAVEKGMKVSS